MLRALGGFTILPRAALWRGGPTCLRAVKASVVFLSRRLEWLPRFGLGAATRRERSLVSARLPASTSRGQLVDQWVCVAWSCRKAWSATWNKRQGGKFPLGKRSTPTDRIQLHPIRCRYCLASQYHASPSIIILVITNKHCPHQHMYVGLAADMKNIGLARVRTLLRCCAMSQLARPWPMRRAGP
jgi:hypothetical protein